MKNVFKEAIHDSSGLSPDMMQKLTYRLTHMYLSRFVLGDCDPQIKPGSRCLVDI